MLYRLLILEGFIAPISFLFYGGMIRSWLMNKNYHYKSFMPIVAQIYSMICIVATHLILQEPISFSIPYIELILNQGLVCIGLQEIIKGTKVFLHQDKIIKNRVHVNIDKDGM